jgi:hypothetical protein
MATVADEYTEFNAGVPVSTRVYAKKGGKWMLVHANFAPIAAAN